EDLLSGRDTAQAVRFRETERPEPRAACSPSPPIATKNDLFVDSPTRSRRQHPLSSCAGSSGTSTSQSALDGPTFHGCHETLSNPPLFSGRAGVRVHRRAHRFHVG